MVPIITLSADERKWLSEVYRLRKQSSNFSIKEIWSKLHKQLGPNFIPSNIDRSLCDYNGERITLLGIVAVEESDQILKTINKLVNAIRQILLADPHTDKISVELISKKAKVVESKVSFYLTLLNDYGQFYRGATADGVDSSSRITTIDVSGDDKIYYSYIHFSCMEDLIMLKVNQARPTKKVLFLPAEQIALNDQLDLFKANFDSLKIGQEIIWTDLMEQIEELKSLYSLGKKSWYQLAQAKFAEMFAGGVVSNLLSNPFSTHIEPFIKGLLK